MARTSHPHTFWRPWFQYQFPLKKLHIENCNFKNSVSLYENNLLTRTSHHPHIKTLQKWLRLSGRLRDVGNNIPSFPDNFRGTLEDQNIGARKSLYSSGSARCFLLQKRARFISEISKSLWNINQFFDSNFEDYTSLHFRDFQPFERTLKIRKCNKSTYSFIYITFKPLGGIFYHSSTMEYT